MAWRFIHSSGLVRKNRASRKAVSAVTDRAPLTMAPYKFFAASAVVAASPQTGASAPSPQRLGR
jgi:hypothetical protein